MALKDVKMSSCSVWLGVDKLGSSAPSSAYDGDDVNIEGDGLRPVASKVTFVVPSNCPLGKVTTLSGMLPHLDTTCNTPYAMSESTETSMGE